MQFLRTRHLEEALQTLADRGDEARVRAGGTDVYTRQQLVEGASTGDLVVTITGRTGEAHEPSNPQPALWAAPVRPGEWTA